MRTYILTLAAAVLALPMMAQTTQRLTADKTNEYALLYTLPSTAVDVTLEIQITKRAPGPFHNYARKYLAESAPIAEASSEVALKSVVINTRATADLDERYQVKFRAGATPTMTLNGLNAPLNVNTDEVMTPTTYPLPQAIEPQPTVLENGEATRAMTQEMIQSTSLSKRAQLVAARIYELRDARSEILSGQSESPFPDGQALKLAIDGLTAQEEALTALFLGTTSTYTDVKTVNFTPDSAGNDVNDRVIVRISAEEGFVDPDDLSGAPVYLSFRALTRGQLPVNEKGVTKTFPKGGLAYRIPGTGMLTLEYDGRQVARAEIETTQLGVTFGIDPALFTAKKGTATAVFNPITGAIVKLGTVSL